MEQGKKAAEITRITRRYNRSWEWQHEKWFPSPFFTGFFQHNLNIGSFAVSPVLGKRTILSEISFNNIV